MDNNIDNLRRLLESIKTIGFWGRLFSWRNIKNQLVDASADLQKLVTNNEVLTKQLSDCEGFNYKLNNDIQQKKEELIRRDLELERLNSDIRELNVKVIQFTGDLAASGAIIKKQENRYGELIHEHTGLKEKYSELQLEINKLIEESGINSQIVADFNRRKGEIDIELSAMKKDYQYALTELNETKKVNTQLLKDEEIRQQKYSEEVNLLTRIQKQVLEERAGELKEKTDLELERLRTLKETWSRHQENAELLIKAICQKHTIQYVEKVPFKGDPDNTLFICDEYIVFDAKSPGSDDLSHFPQYLKDQAEKAKKYAKQENVKSDIFFVVPSNTLEKLELFVYRHGDHNVYIISIDALEPVILGLKKIEEYEFAKELSPEDRENICRILGRFAHLSKRRIQVDSFFAKQFIELAYKCETNLPADLLESVLEFEKSEKLNPPMEKRIKAIPIKELEKENIAINQAAEGQGILMEGDGISSKLNETPLYRQIEA